MKELHWTLDSYTRNTVGSGSVRLLVANSKVRTVDIFSEYSIIFLEYLSFLDHKKLSE